MKISKYFIALLGIGAFLIWLSGSGCTSKQVACANDPTFHNVSKILVNHCSKCHGDSTIAANFGDGYLYDFSNYNLTARDTLNGNPYFQNIDTTSATGTPYNPYSFGGVPFADILGAPYATHPMPLGGPGLTDCEINNIKQWLFNGAPNN